MRTGRAATSILDSEFWILNSLLVMQYHIEQRAMNFQAAGG